MIHWFAIVVPFITAMLLALFFKRQVVWWEFLLLFIISPIAILICQLTTESIQCSDTEFLTGFVQQAEYYEPWDEEVSCRHPRTDKKGNIIGYEHFYDVDYHPAEWKLICNHGTFSTNERHFEELARRWHDRKHHLISRWVTYHLLRGGKYVSNWDGDDEKMEVITNPHRYPNRVIASKSVFKFKEVNPKEIPVINYPEVDHYHQNSLIGWNDPKAEKKLGIWNAKLGREKQVKMFVIVYEGQPIDVALDQENYWQGGNKNEFIICLGIEDNKVQWTYPISWTENEGLKIDIRDHFIAMKELDLNEGIDYMARKVKEEFERKHFKDFNYLSVEPPLWSAILTLFLVSAINVGISVWIIKNEYEEN